MTYSESGNVSEKIPSTALVLETCLTTTPSGFYNTETTSAFELIHERVITKTLPESSIYQSYVATGQSLLSCHMDGFNIFWHNHFIFQQSQKDFIFAINGLFTSISIAMELLMALKVGEDTKARSRTGDERKRKWTFLLNQSNKTIIYDLCYWKRFSNHYHYHLKMYTYVQNIHLFCFFILS